MRNKNMMKVGIVIVGLTAVTACGTSKNEIQEEPTQRRTEQPSVIEMLTDMDQDKDGQLSFDESKGPIKENFTQIDTDGNGFLTVEELKNAPKPEKGNRPEGGGRPEGGRPGGGPPRN